MPAFLLGVPAQIGGDRRLSPFARAGKGSSLPRPSVPSGACAAAARMAAMGLVRHARRTALPPPSHAMPRGATGRNP